MGKPHDIHQLQEALDLVTIHGSPHWASRHSGIPASTLRGRYVEALGKGMKPRASPKTEEATLRAEIVGLRAQLAQLQKDELTDEFVKRHLLKLGDYEPSVADWRLKPRKAKHRGPGIPCTLWSDWHWGEVVNPNTIGGVNEFNLAIARARVKRLVQKVIALCFEHMVNPEYDGLVLFLGGDMVSGSIHDELVATNEKPIMPTVLDLLDVLIWAIQELHKMFPAIDIYCVPGNHGRDQKQFNVKQYNFVNYDWLLYQLIAKWFSREENINVFVSDSPDMTVNVYDHKYLLTHGDQFKGGDGIIGPLGPLTRGHKKKLARNSEIGQEYDTLVCGHWHTYIPLRHLIVNGSLKGYDEWAFRNNFAFEPPIQALWMTNADRGITFSMPLYLDKD